MASKRNGTLYIGSTNSLLRRVHEHKEKLQDSFTKRYDISQLVHYEIYDDVRLANQREANIKHWLRGWKIALIEKHNPNWRDLYEEVVQSWSD